jgi:hypothetical protein
MSRFGDYSGKELWTGEERIGGSPLGLPFDPILNESQTFGRLVDVIAFGDVGKRVEQGVKTLVARSRARESRFVRAYSSQADCRAHSNNLCHAITSPFGATGHATEARTPAPPRP